jgi:hypothetical protein
MNIPEGTVLAHAKRHGWTQQIQLVTRDVGTLQSDAITPVHSVPQSLAAILAERKERTKLGLSKYAAEAAEQAAEHRDKLGISAKVKDVASVHRTLWPNESTQEKMNLQIGILTGAIPVVGWRKESSHESVAAKTEVTLESRDSDRAPGPTSEPVPELSPAQIAAQEKRQKEGEYRERCRDWRRHT